MVFLKHNANFVDSQISSPINMATIQTGLTAGEVNNQAYAISQDFSGLTVVQKDTVFRFHTRSQIKYSDISTIELNLQKAWITHGKSLL